MKGKPSMGKAKTLKEERELAAELSESAELLIISWLLHFGS